MLKGGDLERWMARNVRENADHVITQGDEVRDQWLRDGVVTDVRLPPPAEHNPEDHGCITVRLNAGATEHYAAWNWQAKLRVRCRAGT